MLSIRECRATALGRVANFLAERRERSGGRAGGQHDWKRKIDGLWVHHRRHSKDAANLTKGRIMKLNGMIKASYVGAAGLFPLMGTAAGQTCDPRWSPLGSGVSYQGGKGYPNDVAVFDGGLGPALYVGGLIDTAGGVAVENFARWDGSSWSVPPGGGLTGSMGGSNTSVFALKVHDDGSGSALYAGGIFKYAGGRQVNGIARWDGKAWSPMSNGVQGYFSQVNSLATWDPDGEGPETPVLVLGGSFEIDTDKGPSYNVAMWDGEALKPLGSGIGYSYIGRWVLALESFDDGSGPALYAAVFDPALSHIYRWTGVHWETMSSLDGQVGALAVFDDGSGPALYAAGAFTKIDYQPVRGLARWDGKSWYEAGGGITSGGVSRLTVGDLGKGPVLIVSGGLQSAGGQPASGIAAWDGQAWDTLDGGISENGNAAGAALWDSGTGPALFVGGMFSRAGDVYAQNVGAYSVCRPCRADCDANGSLDLFDFLCFVNVYNAQDPTADCDGNQTLDLFDFLCFVNAFNAGC